MFMSLRTRLFLSYMLVLVVTLIVISGALFVVLRARPFPSEQEIERLASELQTASTWFLNRFGDQNNFRRRDEAVMNQITGFLRRRRIPTRLVVLDSRNTIQYDSENIFRPGSPLNATSEPYTPPFDNTLPMLRGNFEDPNGGGRWAFVALAPQPGQVNTLMLAVEMPAQLGVTQVARLYGDDVLRPLFQAGIIGLVIALVLSYLITRSVARPLQKVAQVAAAVSKGKLNQRAPVEGPSEVRTVAESINTMMEEVAATQAAQRDFLANVTHDLRTPLTSIQGFSQAISEGVASPAAAQRAGQIIYDEAGRLHRMVEELLDLAKIEAGRMKMRHSDVQLHSILNAVVERLSGKASEKDLTIESDVPTLPPILGDGDRLVQVYTNLIDNAIKHTPEGGSITVWAREQKGGILVQISDTGEGIPEMDLPRVFDRFYQVDKSRQSRNRDGAGLGLTITKEIVEAHGGRIGVTSTEGVGTTFSTWYPTSRSAAQGETPRRRTVMRIKE
jgi:two-component system, OmpR family, sensor kinase